MLFGMIDCQFAYLQIVLVRLFWFYSFLDAPSALYLFFVLVYEVDIEFLVIANTKQILHVLKKKLVYIFFGKL